MCAGQWTMDTMIWISSSLDICTYLPYVYIHTVRSGKVGTVHIHPHISAGTRQQDRKSFLPVVYIPESPVPIKYVKINTSSCSFLFPISIHFSPSPNPSPEPSPWLEQICPMFPIHALQVHFAVPYFYGY